MHFTIIPTPEILKADVECIRITDHDGQSDRTVNVCLNGQPGIVFEHSNGHSPIESITTRYSSVRNAPTLYIYGQMTEPGVMRYRAEPFSTIQVVLKPHALQTLLGLNAAMLTNSVVELSEFASGHLNAQLMDTHSPHQQADLIIAYLVRKLEQGRSRDSLIQRGLSLIHRDSRTLTVKDLRVELSLSERQFEKRFVQTVGLAPYFYIRVKRFNQAIKLMKSGHFDKLTDLAHASNFYDQSHFIREVKAFSGITPKDLFQKVDMAQFDQRVYAY